MNDNRTQERAQADPHDAYDIGPPVWDRFVTIVAEGIGEIADLPRSARPAAIGRLIDTLAANREAWKS
jgi:hypothetical protein